MHNSSNTTDLTGEYGDSFFVATRGDSRISLTIAKDEYTVNLTREHRFLIDDYASKNVLAYRLTKPFKLGGSYDENGVLCFVLQECNTEDSDNLELHIANYYDHFPREDAGMENPDNTTDNPGDTDGKTGWI